VAHIYAQPLDIVRGLMETIGLTTVVW